MAEGRTELEIRGPIGIGWIDNPAKRNALSVGVLRDLDQILDTLEQDEKTRVLILSSKNENFSAGFDIDRSDPDALEERRTLFARILPRMEKMPQPILAAVKGYVFGGGFELALASDMIIASDTAQFSLPEAKLGAFPVFAVLRLHHLVGRHKAKEVMMTCRRVPAEEAQRMGLVNEVVPDERLMETAMGIAEEVLKKGPLAIEMIKAAVNRDLGGADLAYMHAARQAISGSEDIREGMRAFFERREPQFKGR